MSRSPWFWNTASTRLATLRVRMTLWYVMLLALFLAAYSAFLLVAMSHGLEVGVDHMLNDGVRQVVSALSTTSDAQALNAELRRLNGAMVMGVYDTSGEQLIAGGSLPAAFERPALPDGFAPRIESVSRGGIARWRVLLQRVSLPGQQERVVLVARSVGYVDVVIDELATRVAIAAPLTLLLAIAGGVFLAGRALGPIDHLTRTAEAISAKDLSRRLGLRNTHDEVGRLAVTFDRMLDRLDRSFALQRQFIADASHELRTPLAMLVSRAGLALDRRRTVDEYERILQAIRDDGLHMGRIVNDLLMLARADAGEALAVSERLDAAELARSVVDAMSALANARGVQLRADADAEIPLDGDQTRLTQLLVNLVENALAHTPVGGQVMVGAARDDGAAILRVSDTGSGIAAEHLPHVFERFFRADRDRPRDRGGAGLGLALCQSIAAAHGGDIRIESQLDHGTAVTVRLPLARGGAPRAPRESVAPTSTPLVTGAAGRAPGEPARVGKTDGRDFRS